MASERAEFLYLVGRIRKALRRQFESLLTDLDLTIPQFQVLDRLWEGDGVPISNVVCDIGSDSATITGVVDRLESRGLVRRERSTRDRRSVFLYLTT